ncbi:MAG: hypothetical protein J1F68_02770 [Clostridiales bacterium]|nr:hypothetical protein [Clostridiales bacterium]
MKKFAIILLSIVLIAACITVVSCKEDQESCSHSWGDWVETAAATCTADGEQTRTCSKCKKVETQSIDALKHQILTEDGELSSCRNVNMTVGAECSNCGELLTGDDLVNAVDHKSFTTIKSVAPTCTETGLSEGLKCLNCGTVINEQEEVEALGHDVVDAPATVASCTDNAYTAGTVCSRCGTYFSGHELVEEAFGHNFISGDYFTLVRCANNCGMYGSKTGGNPFETEFVFDFDETKQEEIDILYHELQTALDGTNSEVDYNEFVTLFEQFDDEVGYIQAQYQFARILNDIEYSAESRATLAVVSEYYNTTIARYYKLFKDIDGSKFRAQFWADTEWDEDYINYVLSLADSYDADNRNVVDEILDAYEDLLAAIGNRKMTNKQRLQLFELYSRLVEANNSIAQTAEYDNYMEYAYERVYERDYSPDEVVHMREFVKEYIGPIVAEVANAYKAWEEAYSARGGWTNRASQLYYSQYVGNWMWGNPNNYLDDAERFGMIFNSRQSIADYFNFLSDGDASVDFYGALNNLFEKGNFFMGQNTNITAYTWYVYSTGTPILVFGGDSNYQDTFTFIHEFGHYYQFVHNDLLSVPMDHDETQSQGNEMLFLAWLRENMPVGVGEGFEILELEQLLNMLGSIVMSTAVDEFEYLVYTGATTLTDGTTPVPMVDGQDLIDYATLYELILKTYWTDIGSFFNTSYWMYVTFSNPAYYISYAMSALPCIELYAKAGNDGLNAARDSYLKLFTFSSDDTFVAEDSFGELYVTKTYQEVLNWAGLSGPFQENLYQSIKTYFESR